jgi:hypothetical protein
VVLGILCAGYYVVPSSLLAQTVRGVLSEEVTEAPIELGTVEAISHAGRVVDSSLTDPRGFFELQLPGDGEYVLRATALGYTTGRSDAFEIMDDGTRILYVNLRPAPVEIAGLVVEADRRDSPDYVPNLIDRGFYERLQKGRGQFLAPGDIAASDAFFTSQLFDGLRNVLPDYSKPAWARGVTYIAATERGNCSPRIFVDGIRISMLLAEGDYLSDIAPIEEVLAAEVFWGPFQAPMRYQGTTYDNSCGVVLLWTRRRTRL